MAGEQHVLMNTSAVGRHRKDRVRVLDVDSHCVNSCMRSMHIGIGLPQTDLVPILRVECCKAAQEYTVELDLDNEIN